MGNTAFKGENSSIVKYWTIINCQESSCWVLSAKGVKESVGQPWLLRKDGEKHVSPGITPPPWVPTVWSSVGPPAHLRICSSSKSSSMCKHRSCCQGTRYSNTLLRSLSNHGILEGLQPWLSSITSPQCLHPTEDSLFHIILVPNIASMLVSWTENGLKGEGAWEIVDSDYKGSSFSPSRRSLNENMTIPPKPCTIYTVTTSR